MGHMTFTNVTTFNEKYQGMWTWKKTKSNIPHIIEGFFLIKLCIQLQIHEDDLFHFQWVMYEYHKNLMTSSQKYGNMGQSLTIQNTLS